MTELLITVEHINPVDFLGVNNERLHYLKGKYPHLKILSRGSKIKLIGESEEIKLLGQKISFTLTTIEKGKTLSNDEFAEIFDPIETVKQIAYTNAPQIKATLDDHSSYYDLVLTPDKKMITAKTPGQKRMVDLCYKNDVLFAIGPAGTGKTYTAVALAVKKLKSKEVKKIILTRPAVEAGESLGYLPGDLKEKIDPYLRPLYDALENMLSHEKLATCIHTQIIEVAPLAYMRGRTLDNAFLILDEAQNATESQLKMFLTRIGKNAKVIITGDLSQVDLPHNHKSGLQTIIAKLSAIKGIATIELSKHETLRHKLLIDIIDALEPKKYAK